MHATRKSCLAVVCLVLGVQTVLGKPEPPAHVKLSLDGEPAVSKPVTVVLSLTASANLENAKIALDLPPGIVPAGADQPLCWQFTLQPREAREFAVEVLIEEPGEYQLSARAAAKTAERLIKMKRHLYLVITAEIAVYSNRSMTSAKRAAIIEKYRRDHKLPSDSEIDLNALPPEVAAELDELNRAAVAPPDGENAPVKPISLPGTAEGAETENTVSEPNVEEE